MMRQLIWMVQMAHKQTKLYTGLVPYLKHSSMIALIFILFLTACNLPTQEQTPTATSETEIPVDLVTVSPTATQPKTLRICTAEFPESLFPYDGMVSTTKTNVLAMLQGGPFEMVEGELQPVILEKIPSQADGDLRLEPVAVQEGQVVINAWGELVVLKPGVLVRTAGCRQSECAIIWDGEGALEMDRMVMEFTLREDLLWSEGTQVTASDSIFSYQLADDIQSGGDRWALDRTESYTALDPRTIQWEGRPGFSSADLGKFFWNPLPSYLYEDTWSLAEIQMDDHMRTSPLSYGPFILTAWDDMHMHFEPNPSYYFADEGLPIINTVTIKLLDGDPQVAWEALRLGQCDLLDSTFRLEDDLDLLSVIQEDDQIETYPLMRGDWMQLVFGIGSFDQTGFLNDPLMRQAIAACLDREELIDMTTGGLSELWSSFLPPERSRPGLDKQLAFDPQHGQDLLAQLGWGEVEGDPGMSLKALDVVDVPMGTELALSLLVSNSGMHQDLAGMIQRSLGECGIDVDVNSMPPSELYASGPNGPLFGRRFDLTLISWQPRPDLDCQYYVTPQIPDADNSWIGTNIAGLSDEDYDQACNDAVLSLPEEFSHAVSDAEQRFLSEMPSMPLFSIPQVVVASSNACFAREFTSALELFKSLAYYDLCP